MAALMIGAPAASGQTVARSDLAVARGTLAAVAGKVSGTVVVRNAGRRTAPAQTLSVTVGTRLVGRVHVAALKARAARTVKVSLKLPAAVRLPVSVRVCADSRHRIRERNEDNNCRALGRLVAPAAPTSASAAEPAPVVAQAVPTPMPLPTPILPPPAEPDVPISTVPSAPIAYTPNASFARDGDWLAVPSSYDATHQTPTELFVWLHGCGGVSEGEIDDVKARPDGPYIALTVGGRENDCWDVDTDQRRVLDAIARVESHFNIDRRRVVIGGYSSGGDLAYRLAFYFSKAFAGVLAMNTTPFRDTGSTPAASLAAASWHFPVVHLAHTGDTSYDIATVRSETDALAAAGFPVTRVERPGLHYDDNTFPDLKAVLLPHLSDGWRVP